MPKTGVDDFLAGGGTIAELKLMALPFDRKDFATVRLGRDEQLRAGIGALWATWRLMPAIKQGQCTDRSTARELIRRAERSGKPVKDGIRVTAAVRTLALANSVSTSGQSNSLKRLETIGFLRPNNEGRAREQAASYVLLTSGRALGEQYGERRGSGGVREREGKEKEAFSPFFKSASDRGVHFLRDPRADVPELRWSTLLTHRTKDNLGRVVEEREYLARLGKKRQAIIEYLLESAGGAKDVELLRTFGSKRMRLRDFKRRILGPLKEAGIILLTVGDVRLTDDWPQALKHARELAGEPEASRLQAQKYARQSKAFHDAERDKHDEVPEMVGTDDLREPWPHHPEPCACRECEKRFGRVIGEHAEDCRCAACFSARKEEVEGTKGRRHRRLVVPLESRKRRTPQAPAPKTTTESVLGQICPDIGSHLEPFLDEWKNHPLDCECLDCTSPVASYARVRRVM